jgi:hypothetical protein
MTLPSSILHRELREEALPGHFLAVGGEHARS